MKTLAIARRELASFFLTPISYVVMTLFLVVEGYSFWLFLELLNRREAPHGAVMQYFFGGTFLYWLFLMFLASTVSMRLVAEERRSGTLEPLLTAPVDAAQVIVGKYLGALAFWVALWTPTLLYVLVLRAYAPAPPDLGPIATGYLGTLLVGAGALAVGLLASTVTKNQIVAAVISFVALAMLLLVGALGSTLVRAGFWSPVLSHLNLFRHMEDFGRGIVDSRHLALHLGLVAVSLFAAARLLDGVSRRGAIEIALVLAIVVGANIFAARHYWRGDFTRGRTFALSDKTVGVLRGLDKPVEVLVFMVPSGEAAHDLYGDVRELLERARRESVNLKVEYLDVDREPERLRIVGQKYKVSGDDLLAGVIVVASGEQSKFITRDELAEYDYAPADEGGPPRLKSWKGEQALASAILEVTGTKAPEVCFVQNHGEPAIDSFEAGQYGDFAEELRRDHHRVAPIDLSRGVPASCDLVAIADPEQPVPKPEADELERYLSRGGRLLVLDGPHFDRNLTKFVDTGLEDLLERWGVSQRHAIAVDEPRLRGNAIAFVVSETYADHPISARLMHRRTIWSNARELRARNSPTVKAREIVTTSEHGWGETDLGVFRAEAELKFDPARDAKGPVPLAVAAESGKARVVVLASAELAGNRELVGYNRDLLLSSVAWLLAAEPRIAIGPRTPEHLRLTLDDAQLSRVFFLCVVAMPFLLFLIGIGVFWVRRS